MSNKIEKCAPPGWDWGSELFVCQLLLAIYLLWFWLVFFVHYAAMVYEVSGSNYNPAIVWSHTVYRSLGWVMRNTLTGLIGIVISFAGYIRAHYEYFRRGSKSIYTMKRLPDAAELHRRCLTLPLVYLATAAVLTAVDLLIAIALYKGNIPAEAVPLNNVQLSVWRMILCLY